MKVRPTNGVSYGVKYTITASDVAVGFVDFDFRIGDTYHFDLVATVQIVDGTGAITMPVDLAVTYPEKGIVRVAGTLVANTVVHLVAQAVHP